MTNANKLLTILLMTAVISIVLNACDKTVSFPAVDVIEIELTNPGDTNFVINQGNNIPFTVKLNKFNPNVTISLEVINGKIDGKTSIKNIPLPDSETPEIEKTVIPDNVSGECIITASIDGSEYQAKKTIDLVKPSTDDILNITFNQTTLNINTSEEVNFEVFLNKDYPERKVNIIYAGGKVDGLNSPVNNVEINTTDGLWQGTFKVDSNMSEGVYPFSVETVDGEYTKQVSLILSKSDASDVLNLSVQTVGPYLADNSSSVNIVATVTDHTASMITFTINKGTFSDGSQTKSVAIVGGIANISLIPSQTPEEHIISATLTNPAYNTSVSITTDRAYPESANLTTSSWSLDSSAISLSNAITFNYQLGRNTGKVSTGHLVTAEAFQMNGGTKVNFGTFYNAPLFTDANEKVSSSYFASPGLDPNLPLIIVFNTDTHSGTLSDTLNIDILSQ
ncbi:hypothetical protein [Parvicella tangerina]|uniref:Ig-like domain repeat protein n=1 Tax=Parvicella tangerina TaxID=2829795 RepID=A0A916JND2_9FLAO|nr:hypothetical protein [Parvicella tangerina]CAG5083792.1 hypothetical protein CRYO30217_02290 [Parvicella tangerina]